MPILARSIPMRTGGQSWSNGASMEPDTLGRAAVPRLPTPIRMGRTQREKCCVSFAITLSSDAMQKLQIVRAPDEASVCSSIVHDGQTATHIAIAISREISKIFSETHPKIPGWQSILAALHPPKRETPTRLRAQCMGERHVGGGATLGRQAPRPFSTIRSCLVSRHRRGGLLLRHQLCLSRPHLLAAHCECCVWFSGDKVRPKWF
jgi:hypothetical protein